MYPHSALSQHALRRFLLRLTTAALACILLLIAVRAAAAQCVANPTGETAVGLKNGSSHYLLFFIDELRMDGVPPGDRSIYFIVTPGEHTLRAEAVIGGETVSASRAANIPEGYVCTWTVTDPPPKLVGVRKELGEVLGGETKCDFARRRSQRH